MDVLSNSEDRRTIYSRSYEHPSHIRRHDEVSIRPSRISENESRYYNTFSSNSDEIRDKSNSVPHMPHRHRGFKRSISQDSRGQHNYIPSTKFIPSRIVDTSAPEPVEPPNADEGDAEPTYCGFTKRKLKCGIALFLLSIVDVMGLGVFTPFFPVVAQEKNVTEVQIGVIFASFSMAGIFASFFTGMLLVRIGPKLIIGVGLFLSAVATLGFGLLERVDEQYFFWLCVLCRIFMGIGSSSAFTALFAVIFQEFADRALTVIGISESLCAVGGILGPLIGGGFYDLGGYLLPFIFLSVMQLSVTIASAVLLPYVEVERQADAVSPARLLLNLHGFFASLFVVLSFIVNSFLNVNISIFLTDSFHVSAFMVGVYLLIFSIAYGISTPIWGYFSDKRDIGAHIMTACCFFGGFVLTLFGPSSIWMSWFGWEEPCNWLVIVCIVVVGSLMGGLIMPTFGEMVVAAKQMRLQQNELAEYGLVSGLWNTVFSVGDILGPTVGGVMTAKYCFNDTLAIFGIMLMGAAVLKAIHLIHLKWNKQSNRRADSLGNEDNQGEDQSLLRSARPSIQT